MLQIGNLVKIKIEGCQLACSKCSVNSKHLDYDQRRGLLAGNIIDDPPPFKNMGCPTCNAEDGFILGAEDHVWVVTFNGNQAFLYREDELDDQGAWLDGSDIPAIADLNFTPAIPVPITDKELITA